MNVDIENDVENTLICRQIVQEILKFGVSDYQKIKIIELIGLELESREQLKMIVEVAKSCINLKDLKNNKTTLITLE
jgi:hypothetical protein